MIVGLANHTMLVRKDGTEIPIDDSGAPIRDAGGNTTGVVLVFRDITERKKAEEQLEQSNKRVNEILNSIQDDFYVLDREWKFVYASKLFTSRIGKEPKDFIGKNIWEMFPKHVGTDFQEHFLAAMDRREVRRFEVGGKYTDAYYMMTAFPSSEGITVLGTDISEHKRDQEALQRSEQRLRRFYESGLIGVIYWNMSGAIVDANERFLQMVGYSREDLAGGRIDWLNMTPPEYRRLDEASVEELKAAGVNRKPFEKEYIRKDGTRIPVIVAGAMLDEERFDGVAFVLDITDRKAAEEEVQTTLQRFYHMLSSMYSGLLLMTEEGRVEFVNQAFCDAYGLKEAPADLAGLPSPDLLGKIKPAFAHPDEAAARIREILERRTGQGRGIRHAGRADGGAGFCPRDRRRKVIWSALDSHGHHRTKGDGEGITKGSRRS